MSIQQTRNTEVWRYLGVLFSGAMLLFLINIWFGFDNAFTEGALPRWQALIHLHAGSIGWITLSAIGVAIWVLSGDRELSSGYERRVGRLVWAAVIVFALYIPNFGIAFSRGDGALVALLPIFGSLAVIVLWWGAVFALSQLGKQETVTTPHILAAGALLVAAIGAVLGMLLGMERVLGEFLPLPAGEDRVGVHAGMMDTYLFLVAAAIIEWNVAKRPAPRWTWPGLIQGVAWALAATLVPVAFLLNMLDELLPVFGLLLIVGLVLFLVRVAWRPLSAGPRGGSPAPWMFFGTVWLVVFLGLFIWAVSVPDFGDLPTWFFAVFAHSGFVGMMTNLILGVIAVRAAAARHVMAWGEPAALWLINLGLVFFLTLKIAADIRWGAAVMGIGVVLGVITMIVRLWSQPARMVEEPHVRQA